MESYSTSTSPIEFSPKTTLLATCNRSRVTVMVPSYNDAENLRRCLEFLSAQSFADFEVLVVDDSSTDDTYVVAKEIASQNPKIRCIRLPTRASRGKVRRLGVAKSKSLIIAFIDSDCVADALWLETLIEPIIKGGAEVSIGPDYLDMTGTAWSKAKADSVRPYRGVDTRNLAISKDLLVRIGNFDERFGNLDPYKPLFGADEAAELAHRLRKKGIGFRQTPAVVYHAFPSSLLSNLKKAALFGRGAFHLYRLRANPLRLPQNIPRMFIGEVRRSGTLLSEPISPIRQLLAFSFRLLFFYIYFLKLLRERERWLGYRVKTGEKEDEPSMA